MAISGSQSKYVDLHQHVAINADKTNSVNSKIVAGKFPAPQDKEKAINSESVATPNMPTPASTSTSPFYLVRGDSAPEEDTTSSTVHVKQDLDQVYQKFFGKKVKDNLSSFLPHLPGVIDGPGNPDTSLRAVIEKPPIGGKELLPLTGHSLAGFRLHPGPIPDQFRVNHQPPRKKHKHKKHKTHDHERGKEGNETPSQDPSHDKKHKKQKKHDDGSGETKKKKKKEKKKKKRHTPEPSPSVNEPFSSTSRT